jgi:transforming growth factor-beta-induced protein
MRMHLILRLAVILPLAVGCGDDDDSSSDATTGGVGAGTGGSTKAGSGGSAGARPGGAGASGAKAGSMAVAGTGGKGSAGAAANGGEDAGMPATKNIVETALAAGNFKQLAAALTKAGLVDALKGDGPFTVFAPSDAAFDALERDKPGTLAGLSTEQLTNVLKYHVVSGAAVKAADLKSGQLVKTLAGPSVAIDLEGGAKVNGVKVSSTDIAATNGVIHVIDAVLLPPGDIIEVATAAGKFTKLAEALTNAGLVSALKGAGPFTVFAPTDDAFAKLSSVPSGDALKSVLQYHVLEGTVGPLDLKEGGAAKTLSGSPVLFTLKDGAKINAAKITTTNVVAKNGVIHIIDTVIVPPADDIVATATAAGNFTKLTQALNSAGLVSALQAKGPFTVFAPDDDAFSKLTTVPTGDTLKNILLYHVVEGAVGSGDLKAGKVPSLLADKSLTIDLTSGVKVDDAKVTKANILTKNGIIHVVDTVLVPK